MTKRLVAFVSLLAFSAGMAAIPAFAENLRETALVRAVKRATPSVVNIHTEKSAADRDSVFSAGGQASKPRKINGMGTGVVIDERGYIVTNYHVVAEVDVIRASLEDNSNYSASVVSFDREHDLAIIKIESTKTLRVMPHGISSDLMLGEPVIAVGNAFGYQSTVTSGIISALGRDVEVNETQSYKNLIQTDASINPGNSGGPLLNMNGEVVGINVAIRAGAQRIGFAIPIDDARGVIARLMSVEQLNQTTHGVVSKDIKTPTTRQLLVERAAPESPAAKAGLLPGDVVVKVGDKDVVDAVDLERCLLGRPAGETIPVVVKRGDKTETLSLALAPHVNGRSRVGTDYIARANNDNTEAERFWTILGLKLAPLAADKVATVPTKYRGGLTVVDVRAQSPAAMNGIRKDDILVGLRDYETLTFENITWILNQPLPPGQNGLKFYVIRGRETLYGFIQTASADAPAAAVTK